MLKIQDLEVEAGEEKIIKGVDLKLKPGEIHAIMGPNGSGKSTLANSLMGHPGYEIIEGTIKLDEQDITESESDEKAQAGLFLSLQYPPEIEGLGISNFLRTARESLYDEEVNPMKFQDELKQKMKDMGIDPEFADRSINDGFSGGEKKKSEILQLLMLDPKYAILDETDSGLDVDALKTVAEGLNNFSSPDKGILLITHYKRILEYIEPDTVHIMKEGQLVRQGDYSLAEKVEAEGYDDIT
ncbi:MAG: Fe-S cluster assembly ATPase SufC [Candidatus Paceibacteria bacterium]